MDITVPISSQDLLKEEPAILVSPNNPTPWEKIFLSNIDQALNFPVETLFFYEIPPKGGSSTVDISERVKRAVAEVLLIPYYFLAGRLGFNHESNRLELICNNAGVLFVSATTTLMLKDLGNLALPNPTFKHFVHRPGLHKSLAETALFTIQVTRFACGSFSIGFVTNHTTLDGKSASEMFQKLASICKGNDLKSHVICTDRTCFKARNPPKIKFPHKEYVKQTDISSIASSFTSPDHLFPSRLIFSKKKCIHKLFSLTPKMIRILKQQATIKCSSFEATVAHLWRARTKAVFKNRDDFSTILFAVDIRSKLSPPLPKDFAGNAVVTAFATTKVGKMVEEPLSFCVEKVKEAKERITGEYVRSVIDWLEVYRGVPASGNQNFYVSAWWKLPLKELDFGFGNPSHGGPVADGNDEFVLLLSDGKLEDEAGINLWVCLKPTRMKRFMSYIYQI